MTSTVYRRESSEHASDASFVATIIAGVVLVLAIIVQIVAIALPYWQLGLGHEFRFDDINTNIWELPTAFMTDWIRAVQAFEILAILCGVVGVVFFSLMMYKFQTIWSQAPLSTVEKAIVIGHTAASFIAGAWILVAYGLLADNTDGAGGIVRFVSLFSGVFFWMGSGLSGKAAADIILYRK